MGDSFDRREERIYRITVRTLYVAALVLNMLVIYEQLKDTPEAEQLKNRAAQFANKIKAKATEKAHFRRQANAVIFEAVTVVEEQQRGTNDD